MKASLYALIKWQHTNPTLGKVYSIPLARVSRWQAISIGLVHCVATVQMSCKNIPPQNSVAAKSSKETKPINRSELRRNRAFWWQDSCPVVVLKYATVSTAKTFRVGQRRRQTKTANRQTSRLRNKSQININRANAEG